MSISYNGEYKIVYHVEVRDLVYAHNLQDPSDSPFHQLSVLPYTPQHSVVWTDSQTPRMSETYFDEEWSGLVIRTAMDYASSEGDLQGTHFYMGRFNHDGTQVVATGRDLCDYGLDVTWNGFRVTATANEVTWGVGD